MRELVGTATRRSGTSPPGTGSSPGPSCHGPVATERRHGLTETTVHEAAARLLGLALGDEVRLGGNSGFHGLSDPITLVVVGTFRPASDLGWESDPLTGEGVDPDYRRRGDRGGVRTVRGRRRGVPGQRVGGRRLRVTARPDIAHADRGSVTAAVEAYEGAGDRLAADLADRVQLTRVASPCRTPCDRIEAQRAASRSHRARRGAARATLSLAALLLAGRLVAAVRDEERVLLVSFGASRRQQLLGGRHRGGAAGPRRRWARAAGAALAHSRLTHLAGPAAAGLSLAPTITGGLVPDRARLHAGLPRCWC